MADSHRPLPRWKFVLGFLLALVLAVALDAPLARWSINDSPLEFLVSSLEIAEGFGHGVGVALIVITVWVLDPARRRVVPWILAGAWGGGLAANVVKFSIGRLRPWLWLESADHHAQHGWDSFFAWFPMGEGGSGHQSFPSAHTASAFGLAVMLSTVYPRGRRWFFTLATLVGIERVTTHAHFASDVLIGGLLGWLVAGQIAKGVSASACGDSPGADIR